MVCFNSKQFQQWLFGVRSRFTTVTNSCIPTKGTFFLKFYMHYEAKKGFKIQVTLICCRALEQFIRKNPDLINLRKDDGYTPLHLAALNDHLDVVTMLVDHVSMCLWCVPFMWSPC